ncbi:33582_t:CDS:1, partial [Gigaspora margarita]
NDNFIKRLQNNLQFSTSINKEYNSFKEKLEKLTNQLKECEQQRLFDINLIKELETNNNNLKTENNQLIVKINQLINEIIN